MGDRLLVGFVAIGLTVLVVFAGAVTGVVAWLVGLPAPTEHWAAIITGLAWPITIVLLSFGFRAHLARIAEALTKRVERGAGIEIAGVKIEAETQTGAQSAVAEIMRLISMKPYEQRLAVWLAGRYPAGPPTVWQFLMEPLYSTDHMAALLALRHDDR